MLTKETTIDKIEIVGEYKILQIREVVTILEDGNPISHAYHRRTILPTADVSSEPQDIQNISSTVHTQNIKDAYNTYLQSLI